MVANAICLMPFPGERPEPPLPHPTLGNPSRGWIYKDSNGEPLGYVLRWDKPTAEDPRGKTIRPLTLWQLPNGQPEWKWQTWPEPRPLYGLDRLAARPDAPVLVVEGEKAADAAGERFPGYVVVTSPGGANAPAKADWTPLRGRKIVTWPDADEPGHSYAAAVAEFAHAAGAASVSVVSVPSDFPEHWDLADRLPDGVDPHSLRTMLDTAKAVERTVASTAEEWPEPEALPGLPSVAPFDYDLLPDALRPWVQDIAERLQCPPDFVAIGVMVALGGAIGRRIVIRPKRQDNWTVVPNLWGMVIGRPSVMKSPALSEAMKPLSSIAKQARDNHERELAEWEKRAELASMKRDADRKAIKKAMVEGKQFGPLPDDADEPKPKKRRYIINNTTVEAVAELLRENPKGVLVYRDELVSWLRSLDEERNAEARGFYLTAWNGTDSHTTDRIGRGFDLHVEGCCVSLLGGTQPAAIDSYLSEATETGGGDGMLARFGMLVWPDIAGDWRNVDRWPNAEARNIAYAVFERLVALDGAAIGETDDHGELPFLRFEPAAQAAFDEWRELFEPRVRSGEEQSAFESHLAKYRKLVPALALVLHLADAEGGCVSEAALRKALGWATYLESHARRAYAAATAGDASPAQALLRRIEKGDVRDGFTEREVYRKDWSGLSQQEVTIAVNVLAAHGYLRPEVASVNKAGGRPKRIWHIHPDVLASRPATQHAA